MNLNNFNPNWNKPSKFTAEVYDTKVTVEYDHSDIGLEKVMDAFETLVTGMGYHKDAWKEWILDRAAEYQEEENEKWDEDGGFGQPYTIDDFKRDEEEAVRSIIKTKKDAKIFADALENPPAPNEKLKEAVDEFRKEIKKQKSKK